MLSDMSDENRTAMNPVFSPVAMIEASLREEEAPLATCRLFLISFGPRCWRWKTFKVSQTFNFLQVMDSNIPSQHVNSGQQGLSPNVTT